MIEPVASSGKPSFKQSATPKPPKGKKGRFYLLAYKKAAVAPVIFAERDKRSYHTTKYYSARRVM